MDIETFNTTVINAVENKLYFGRKAKYTPQELIFNISMFYPKFSGTKLPELYYWIIHKMHDYKKCKICGCNVTKFRTSKDGYNSDYCKMKCAILGTNRDFKSKQTLVERYGEDSPQKIQSVKDKTRLTCQSKYGTDFATQSDIIKAKTRLTFFARYGDDYFKTRAKYKALVLPSGKIVKFQGYENVAIEILLKQYPESDIKIHEVPKIFYEYDNITKFHLPDIYIPSKNLLIEVKSEYTLNIKLEQNLRKQLAAKNSGFFYEIWVCSPKKVMKIM